MAITYIGSATGTCNYSTSVTVNVPASTANNDIMIAIVGGTRASAPSGWTLIDSANSGTSSLGNVYAYWRKAASEPASYTFSLSGSWLSCGVILTYRGVNTTTPVDVTNEDVSAVGAGTGYTTATVTAPANTWALSFATGYEFGSSSSRTFTEGSGTERVDFAVTNSASPDNTNLSVTDSNGTISSGNFSRSQTRSSSGDGGVRGIILLNVANVAGSASAAGATVDVTAYNPVGQTGTAAAAPKAAATAAAFNPQVFAGHFGFAGLASVSAVGYNPQETGRATVVATVYAPTIYFGTPAIRNLKVDPEVRVKSIPKETRVAQVEDG